MSHAWVALLRAVNVGGTGKLPMAELRDIATTIGFEDVRTYIQSGNLLFSSDLPEEEIRVLLGKAPVESTTLSGLRTPGDEEVVAGRREIYVHYPNGMGQSKFVLPRTAGPMTVRNMNTLTKLAASASG